MQFIERYEKIHGESSSTLVIKKKKTLTRRNSDDTESESESEVETLNPTKPWLNEWDLYLQTHETVPEDMGIVRWWGVRLPFFCFCFIIHSFEA